MNGTDETKAFADRLIDLLAEAKKKGANHRQVAIDSGIGSHASLSKYASDTAEAGLNSLVKLARYFNVSLDYLVGLTNTRNPKPRVQGAVKYTGLSEHAIEHLHSHQSTPEGRDFLVLMSKLFHSTTFFLALASVCEMLEADRKECLVGKIDRLKDGGVILRGKEIGDHHSYFAQAQFLELIQELRDKEKRLLYGEE